MISRFDMWVGGNFFQITPKERRTNYFCNPRLGGNRDEVGLALISVRGTNGLWRT